ncbi:Cytochrome P450 4c3 [Carabus blaptoides fortunei]
MQFLVKVRTSSRLSGPTAWPILGSALLFSGSTEDIYRNIMMIISTYSSPSRVWLGNRLFVFISKPQDLEIILNNSKSMEKENLYKFAEAVVGKGLFTASVEKWKRHRKIIMPTFNQKILDTFMDVFVEQSNILAENLERYLNKGYFDIFEPISLCTLDIICETAMGIQVNAQNQDCKYVKLANIAMGIIFGRMFKMWHHFDFIFNMLPESKQLSESVKELHAFTDTVIKQKRVEVRERLKQEKNEDKIDNDDIKIPKRKAFLEMLLELSEQGTRFTDEELREEVDTLMIAGSDTTASINSFTCVMLGAHPEVQEKAYEEIVEVVGGTNGTITTECLSKLQYLERVIKETMRLFPVGPAIVRAITDDLKLESCTKTPN